MPTYREMMTPLPGRVKPVRFGPLAGRGSVHRKSHEPPGAAALRWLHERTAEDVHHLDFLLENTEDERSQLLLNNAIRERFELLAKIESDWSKRQDRSILNPLYGASPDDEEGSFRQPEEDFPSDPELDAASDAELDDWPEDEELDAIADALPEEGWDTALAENRRQAVENNEHYHKLFGDGSDTDLPPLTERNRRWIARSAG